MGPDNVVFNDALSGILYVIQKRELLKAALLWSCDLATVGIRVWMGDVGSLSDNCMPGQPSRDCNLSEPVSGAGDGAN